MDKWSHLWEYQSTYRGNFRRSRKTKRLFKNDIENCGHGKGPSPIRVDSFNSEWRGTWGNSLKKSNSSRHLSTQKGILLLTFKERSCTLKRIINSPRLMPLMKFCLEIFWTAIYRRPTSRSLWRKAGRIACTFKRQTGCTSCAPSQSKIETCGWAGSDI